MRAFVRKHRFGASLTAIAVTALAWRVGYDLMLRHHEVGGDGFRYHFGALALADGQGFVNPIAALLGTHVADTGHPPAWTLLLAGVSKLSLRSWLQHGLFASVFGTATVVMTGLAARAAFGRRAGVIAAALGAAYPFFWIYEREVLSEVLAMLLIAALIWLVYSFCASPSTKLALALGICLGALVMTKSDQILVGVGLILPVILSRRDIDLRQRFTWLALAAAACAVIMAPWSIYLSTRYDRPVIVSGSVGATMAAGNCTRTYHGELVGWYDFNCALLLKPTNDPLKDDAKLESRTLDFMRAHKGRVPVVMAVRVGRTFGIFRPFQQTRIEFGSDIDWAAIWGFFMYWALLPFAIAGVLIARRRRIPLYPLLVFPAVVVLTVLLTIGSVRYRAPAEVPLVILAAAGVDALLNVWSQRVNVQRVGDTRSRRLTRARPRIPSMG